MTYYHPNLGNSDCKISHLTAKRRFSSQNDMDLFRNHISEHQTQGVNIRVSLKSYRDAFSPKKIHNALINTCFEYTAFVPVSSLP